MSYIFVNPVTQEKSIVVGPREMVEMPFSVGDWTELRIGGFFSMVKARVDPKYCFFDTGPNNLPISTVGNAYQVTSPKTVGNGSGYFDNNGNYLQFPMTSALTIGVEDFTFEGWFYQSAAVNGGRFFFTGAGGGSNLLIVFLTTSNNVVVGRYGVNDLTSAGTVPTGVWFHLAVTRASNTVRIFINGQLDGNSATVSASYGAGESGYIGAPSPYSFNGYMNGVRLLKGQALYTDTFTPPATQFTSIANTALLLTFDNFTSTATYNDPLTNATDHATQIFTGSRWDRFLWGLKTYDGLVPEIANNYFAGNSQRLLTDTSFPVSLDDNSSSWRLWTYGQFGNLNTWWGIWRGTTNSMDVTSLPFRLPSTAETFFGGTRANLMKFVLGNKNLSNQTLTITLPAQNNTNYTNPDKTTMRILITNFSNGVVGSAQTWNNGATAYPVSYLNCLVVRNPFYHQSIRIHCVEVVCIS